MVRGAGGSEAGGRVGGRGEVVEGGRRQGGSGRRGRRQGGSEGGGRRRQGAGGREAVGILMHTGRNSEAGGGRRQKQ